jgi:hypothetical protein
MRFSLHAPGGQYLRDVSHDAGGFSRSPAAAREEAAAEAEHAGRSVALWENGSPSGTFHPSLTARAGVYALGRGRSAPNEEDFATARMFPRD